MQMRCGLCDRTIATSAPEATGSGGLWTSCATLARPIRVGGLGRRPEAETLYHRDDALLYIAYVMPIWAAPIPADRWHCSLWP